MPYRHPSPPPPEPESKGPTPGEELVVIDGRLLGRLLDALERGEAPSEEDKAKLHRDFRSSLLRGCIV